MSLPPQSAPRSRPAPEMTAEAFALRVSLFYAALFLIYGVQLPFLPVWLDQRGLTAQQVAIITSAPYLLRLVVTPVFGLVADRTGDHRGLCIALAWFALAAILFLPEMVSFWGIFAIAVPFALAAAAIMPLVETIAVAGVRTYSLDYGRMRLWGSLAFILVGMSSGSLLDWAGTEATVWLLTLGAVATVVSGHALPGPPIEARNGGQSSAKLVGPEVRRLLAAPVFLAFIAGVSAIQAAHALFYTFGALHLQMQGISALWIGVLWAIAVFAEVILFAYAGRWLKSVSAGVLLLVGGAAAVMRWLVMSLDPPLGVLVGLQVLHALTYAATHLGAMRFIAEAAPERAAGTAQALHSTFAAGIVMGLAVMISGWLYETFAGGAYLAMAALAGAGLGASVFVWARWDGQRL